MDADWDDIDAGCSSTEEAEESQNETLEEVIGQLYASRQKYASHLGSLARQKAHPHDFSTVDFDPHSASFYTRMIQILEHSPDQRIPKKHGPFLLDFAVRCPLFKTMNLDDDIATTLLLEHAEVVMHKRGERLFSIGDINTHIFIILSGVVSILASTSNSTDSTQQVANYISLIGDYPIIAGKFTTAQEYAIGSLGPTLHIGQMPGNVDVNTEKHSCSAIVYSPVSHLMRVPINALMSAWNSSIHSKTERVVRILKNIECTSLLSLQNMTELASHSKIVVCKGDPQVVLKQGDQASHVAIILSGMFRLVRKIRQHKKKNILIDLKHLGECDLFVGVAYGKNMPCNNLFNPLERGHFDSSLISCAEYVRSEVLLIDAHKFMACLHSSENATSTFRSFLKSHENSMEQICDGLDRTMSIRKTKAKYVDTIEKYSRRKRTSKSE